MGGTLLHRETDAPIQIFFYFSLWLFLAAFLFLDLPRHEAESSLKKSEESQSREIRTLLENERQADKEKDKVVFLSDQNNKGQGQLTPWKGFEALSETHRLAFRKRGELEEMEKQKKKDKDDLSTRPAEFYVKIFKEPAFKEKGMRGNTTWGQSRSMEIPSNYLFRNRFALSWDRNGEPVIPTKDYKHYTYFKRMVDRIRDNFSPPGGIQYPIYGDDYHSMNPVPGRQTSRAVQPQIVKVVFMLDENGDVNDLKLWESLGYPMVDNACLEAIQRARNFGPPPPELLENGNLIIPFMFILF